MTLNLLFKLSSFPKFFIALACFSRKCTIALCLLDQWQYKGRWSSLNYVHVGHCTTWSLMLGTDNIISPSSLYSFNNASFGIAGHKSLRLGNKPLTIGLDMDIMPAFTSNHSSSSLRYPKRASIPFLFINSNFKICTPPYRMWKFTPWSRTKAYIRLMYPYQYDKAQPQ